MIIKGETSSRFLISMSLCGPSVLLCFLFFSHLENSTKTLLEKKKSTMDLLISLTGNSEHRFCLFVCFCTAPWISRSLHKQGRGWKQLWETGFQSPRDGRCFWRQAGCRLFSAEANYAIYAVSMLRRGALDGCWCSAQNTNLCSEPPAGTSDKHLI